MLGQTLNLVTHAPDFDAADLEILREAKDSRNYIAHQGADFESVVDISDEMLVEYIAKLRIHVERLAKGDNVVSKWCYEFIERETGADINSREVFIHSPDLGISRADTLVNG